MSEARTDPIVHKATTLVPAVCGQMDTSNVSSLKWDGVTCLACLDQSPIATGTMSAKDLLPEAVHHPSHYNENSKGIECIDVVEELTFNTGNAMKYLWRAGHKGDIIEDLKKARWYIDREIQRLGG